MDRTRQTVIFMLIGTLMCALPVLMFATVPASSLDLLNLVLGFFLAKGGDAVGYLLNSTAGSNQKTDALMNMARRSTDKRPPEASVSDPAPVVVDPPQRPVGEPRGPE